MSSIENLLRPYLLTQANSLSVLLSFFGFLGGILAFGFIGVFLGPVLLAVEDTAFFLNGRLPTPRSVALLVGSPAEKMSEPAHLEIWGGVECSVVRPSTHLFHADEIGSRSSCRSSHRP